MVSVAITDETLIGYGAFQNCVDLTNVVLNAGIVSIGYSAFYNCTGLTSLILPEGMTSINQYAFRNCSNLRSVTIPDSMKGVDKTAFDGCNSALFDTTTVEGLRLVDYWAIGYTDTLAGDLDLSGVRGLANSVFSGNTGLTSVKLQDDMEEIGSSSFSGCRNLKHVTMREGIANIGSSAFSGCSALTDIDIPSSVTNIADYAFQNCSSLISLELPDGLLHVGQYAFSGCSNLRTMNMPSTVERIDNYAFNGCSRLTRVDCCDLTAWFSISFGNSDANPVNYSRGLYVDGALIKDLKVPDDVFNIKFGAFFNCTNLTSVTMHDGVTNVAKSAFCYCSGITNVVLSANLVNIGDYAFDRCQFAEIDIPASVRNIGYGAFYECMALMNAAIPEGVTTIGASAFYNCTNLTAIAMPSTIHDITNSVFSGCSGLRDVVLPSSVTNIRASAFQNCSSLSEIELPANLKAIGASAFQDDTGLLRIEIPEGVTSIGNNAFYGCTNIVEVLLPSTLRTIGEYAFYNCSSLASVVIPEGVTSIGQYAFNSCGSLSNVTIPQSVTSIGQYAFNGCNDLNVTIADGVTSIPNSVFSGCAGLSSVTIPSSVTTIGDNAFYNCSNLSNPTIPSSVKSIGSYAFYGCSKLTDVVIPEGVTSLGTYSFANCANLERVSLPSTLRSVGQNAFSGCNKLKSLAIADGITNIGQNAFAGCSNLETVTIPSTVTSIGSYAFQNCRNLANVEIPMSVRSIGAHAFEGCKGMASVSLADSLSSIGEYAFSGCTNLTALTIPQSVTSIGQYAFSACTNLMNVTFMATNTPSVSASCFKVFASTWSVQSDGSIRSAPITHNESSRVAVGITGGGTLSFDWKVSSESGCDFLSYYIDGIRCANPISGAVGWQTVSISLSEGNHTVSWVYSKDYSVNSNSDCGWIRNVSLSGRMANVTDFDSTRLTGLSVGAYAFYNCIGLSSVNVKDLSAWCRMSFGNSWANPLTYAHDMYENGILFRDVIIPEDVYAIKPWAFNGSSLTNVVFSDKVFEIGKSAFRLCGGLGNVMIPASVESVSAYAFELCTNMNNLVFAEQSALNGIGEYACQDCTVLTNVNIPVSAAITTNTFWRCREIKMASVPANYTMSRIFPHSYAELQRVDVAEGTVRVCASAFAGCSMLDAVTIPASVTNIAENAFVRCPSLSDISVADGNAYYKEMDGALYTKDGTKIVCCPASVAGAYALPDEVSVIGAYAFNGCDKLTGISIPAGVTTMPLTAFVGCTSLSAIVVDETNAVFRDIDGVVFTKDGKTLVLCPPGFKGNYKIPDGVTDIADNAFAGCVHLTGVTFPSSMRKVGTSAFEGCSALSDVGLNENLDEIGSYAFRNCASLTSLTVPDAVIKLGKDAFVGCTALTNLVLPEGLQLAPEALSGAIAGTRTLNRGVVYHVTGNLTIGSGATLNIPSGAILKMASGVSITVDNGGTLNAQGTRSSPVVFTSIKDDAVGGDTNGDGSMTNAGSGDWARIYAGGTVNMNHCIIRYCNNNSDYGAIHGTGGTVTFDNGTIEYSVYECVRMNSGRFTARNSVFRESSMGFGYYGGSGVYVYNCVVADCMVACRAANKHFYNTVFYRCQTFLESTSSSCSHCVFYNPDERNYTQTCSQVGANGNIWGDPLFTDDGYRITIDSPCVDAGDGAVAPSTDYFGQTRQTIYEDAMGKPDGDGNYPDIGIHEVMPRIVTNDVDLAVVGVETPEAFVVGQKATVSWMVKNLGSKPVVGSWGDTVELVCANGAVVLLGTLPVSTELAAGGTRTFSGTFTVPSAQVGNVKVRVTANANRDIFEGTLTANNVAESEAATLTMPELAFSDTGTASFNLPAGGSVGYKLGEGFAAGGLLIVHVSGGQGAGRPTGVNVWSGNGQVPTADIFYAAAVEVGGGDYLVRVPAGGDAYVSFANGGSGLAKVEVGVETGAFLLFDTGVVTAPNEGTVSLSLYGNGFADDMEVWITNGRDEARSSHVVVFDSVKAVATFDVTGLAAGAYEVHVRKGGVEDAASLLALTQQKVGPKWSCKLDIASAVRSSREYVGYLEYANSGDMPLDAPYVKITAGSGSFIRFGTADAWGDTLELMATSETYPASQLKPGETRRIPFRYKTTVSSLSIECGYTQDDPSAFPWDTNASYMRPSWASDELWGLSLAVLKSNVGATWNDYLARMRANCDHLAKIGQPTHRLDRIWQLEINEALGVDHAVSTLASNTDLARSGRGFGLALSRSYGSGLYRRLRKGIFGYGWSDNYSAYAELQNSGATLALHSGNGSTYLFEKVNGKWTPEDARDKTTCTETSTEYILTYRSGTVQRIAKDNMRVSSVRDNQGNSLSFTYNAATQLVNVAHCDGQSLSFTYGRDALVASATDDQGRTTRYEYSGDLLVKVTAFNGLSTQYRYLPADGSVTSRALRQIAYADGTTRDYTYDGAGRVATVAINGNRQTVEIVRKALGSYIVVAPNGGETQVTLGASGEVRETVNALGQKSTRTYTADTLLESVVGPTGKRAKIAYDEDGQAVKATDAAGADTLFGYTSDFGNLAKVTDARGNSFDYGYDKLGRSKSISYADGSVESIAYDDRGNVTNSVNRRGQSITFTYDNEGNTLSKVWENGRTFTWAYDAKGNCTNATDSATGTVTMEYDENERLTRIVHPKSRGFAYTYDALGRTISRTTLVGRGAPTAPSAADIQRYEYDSLGRLSRMTDGDGNLYVENAYDETTGWLITQNYGNGTIVSNAYDILGRTIGIYHGRAGTPCPPWLAFFEYAYDAEGRRISQTTAEGTERYTYDTVGQLTDVIYPDGSEEHFTYDAVGNRITSGRAASPLAAAATTTYTANNLNQYTTISGGPTSVSAIEYDLDGNMTRKGDTRYYYDIQNRLVAVTNETADIRWSCEYDVFGNRTKVIDHDTAKETLFVQGSLASAVAEFDGEGAVATRHILLGSVRLADISNLQPSNLQPSTTYYHADGLASTRLLTDANGNAIATASYRAFGEVRTWGGPSSVSAMAGTEAGPPSAGWVGTLGVERDDATGLIFMRNRYYDAEQGRFIQSDMFGINSGDENFYRYCHNSPINRFDPSGNSDMVCVSVSARTLLIAGGVIVGCFNPVIGATIVFGALATPALDVPQVGVCAGKNNNGDVVIAPKVSVGYSPVPFAGASYSHSDSDYESGFYASHNSLNTSIEVSSNKNTGTHVTADYRTISTDITAIEGGYRFVIPTGKKSQPSPLRQTFIGPADQTFIGPAN